MPSAKLWIQGVLQDIFRLMLSGGGFVVKVYCVKIQVRLNTHRKRRLISHF